MIDDSKDEYELPDKKMMNTTSPYGIVGVSESQPKRFKYPNSLPCSGNQTIGVNFMYRVF